MARGDPNMKRLLVSKASGGHRSAKGSGPLPLASPLASSCLGVSPASAVPRARADGASSAPGGRSTPLEWARCWCEMRSKQMTEPREWAKRETCPEKSGWALQ